MVDVPLERAQPVSRFGSLRIPQFRILFATSALFFGALQAQQIARAWLAIELTGDNAGVGAVFMAFGVPMLVLSPVGGVITDRFPKKAVLTVCQATILAAALMIAVCDAFGVLEYWMLLFASAVHGCGLSVLGPARMAFTSEVVDRRMLPNAVVLQQMAVNGTRVVGPAIAGVLIAIPGFGAGGVFILTSTLFAVSILMTSRLTNVPVRGQAERGSPRAELVDGLRYLRSRRQVSLLMAIYWVLVVVGVPYLAFLPFVATDVFDVGSSGYGVMSAVSAVAAVLATVWLAGRINHGSVWRLQAVFGLAFSVGLVVLGIVPDYVLLLVVLFFLGGAQSAFQTANASLVLTETELEYHGRMQSMLMTAFALSSVVSLPIGILADAVGLRATLIGMGVVCTIAMALYVMARRRVVAAENLPF